MPYAIECPGCTEALRVPDHAGGRRARCPKCAATMRVPQNEDFVEPLEDDEVETDVDEAPAKPKRKRKTLLDYEDEMAPSLINRRKPAKKSKRR
jgi:hypothetical protein